MNQNLPPEEDQVPADDLGAPDEADALRAGPSSDPQWLRRMGGWEETPEWLRELIRQSEGEQVAPEAEWPAIPAEEGAAEPAVGAPAPIPAEGEGIPEWLQRAGGPEEELAAEAGEAEELPEWLQGLQAAGEAEAEEEAAVLPAEIEGVPEWLGRAEEAGEAAEGEELPGWLQGLQATGEAELEEELAMPSDEGEGVPEWLGRAEEAGEAAEAEEELPEWLRGVDEALEAEEAPGTPAAEEQELPEWLLEMAEELAEEPVEGVPETGPAEEPVLPAVGALAPEEAIPQEGVEAWPEEGVAEAEGELELPEWLYALEDEAPPEGAILGLAEVEELSEEEMPAWVEELRPEEFLEAEEEVPVETSGPLAGLAGLLNPEPLLGLVPKSAYKPLPPVPETHHAQAKLIRQILAAPLRRPAVVSPSPGRKVMEGLGRWLIYAALLAAICAAVFVPQLQGLIQPSETLETKDFYNVVEGLPEGSQVLLVIDYDASHDGELTPQARAILWHLLSRNLGVVTISHTPQGAAIVQDLFQSDAFRLQGIAYAPGWHYLNLGYLPPHPASLQAFMAHPLGGVTLWGMAQAQASQTALGQRVQRFDDLDLIVLVSGNQEHLRWWIEQVGSQRQVDIVASVSAAIVPYIQPYYAAASGRQLQGILFGLAGAAEYERLSDARFWPSARENLILQGCAQLLLAAIVIVSGISFLIGPLRGT